MQIISEYPAPPDSYPEYSTKSLRLRLDLDNLPPEIGLNVEKILTRYEVTYYSLGPYGAEFFLYSEVKQRVTQLIQDTTDSILDSLPPDQYARLAAGGTIADFLDPVHPRLRQVEATLSEFRPFFEPEEGDPPVTVPFSWCTPKVKLLVETLFHRHTPSFQGIVFVEQRHIARSLATIISRIPILTNLIKCEHLVGHGAGTSAKTQLKGMGIRGQQDTVKMFRERQLNLRTSLFLALSNVLTTFL